MRQSFVIILGLLLISGCDDSIEKFVFDTAKVSTDKKYFYEYKSDKLKSEGVKTYMVMYGKVVDSMVTKTDYEYNEKGLLKLGKTYFEKSPDIDLFDYDSNDSLCMKMMISPEGDTTFWEKYEYRPDGRKIKFHRNLVLHLDPTQDFREQLENKTYDTIFYESEFEYTNNLCQVERQFDQHKNLIKLIEYQHIKGILIGEIYSTYLNNMKLIEKVKHYNYSKSDYKPDFYSLNSMNDTIEYCRNEFDNGKLAISTELGDNGNRIIKSFFENGLVIGQITVDNKMKIRSIDSNTFYENGKIKEQKNYHEKINAH
jgi:hypothetical protein